MEESEKLQAEVDSLIASGKPMSQIRSMVLERLGEKPKKIIYPNAAARKAAAKIRAKEAKEKRSASLEPLSLIHI